MDFLVFSCSNIVIYIVKLKIKYHGNLGLYFNNFLFFVTCDDNMEIIQKNKKSL